jgi:hypothetical protein
LFLSGEARVKNKLLVGMVMMAALLSMCGTLSAHHGSASYAMQPTTLKNVSVTKVNWGNPHTLLLFDVKNDKGVMEHWVAEANAASAISTSGWTKTAIKPGDTITVVLYVAKNGQTVGRVGKVVLADGREFGDGSLIGDRPSVCDDEFTTGGNESSACRPGGRITNNLEKK